VLPTTRLTIDNNDRRAYLSHISRVSCRRDVSSVSHHLENRKLGTDQALLVLRILPVRGGASSRRLRRMRFWSAPPAQGVNR